MLCYAIFKGFLKIQRHSISFCECLLWMFFLSAFSVMPFVFGCSQCSIQTPMIHHRVMMRACRTPDPPSSRQHTASKVPLTSIRLKLYRTWVENTWWEDLWSCLWFKKCSEVLFQSFFSFQLLRVLFGPWSFLTAGGSWLLQARTMWSASGCWRPLLITSITWD